MEKAWDMLDDLQKIPPETGAAAIRRDAILWADAELTALRGEDVEGMADMLSWVMLDLPEDGIIGIAREAREEGVRQAARAIGNTAEVARIHYVQE